MYRPPFFLFNGHLESIYPALFRKVRRGSQSKYIVLSTEDDDILEAFHTQNGSKNVVILSHGLEGNAHRPYMLGMANACQQKGFDTISWNYRGCGDTMNRQLRFYHSGATDDLAIVIRYALNCHYQNIFLIGFSLGGNIVLKYLGEQGTQSPIQAAACISVPLDLHASCIKISGKENVIYSRRFLKSLKAKIITKAKVRPELNIEGIEKLRTLIEFDDRYTGPLHGFANALHYYQTCSSINYVGNIRTDTLVLNALNDPLISAACYNAPSLRDNRAITFLTPARGGHVGFTQFGKNGLFWSDEMVSNFLSNHLVN